MSRLQQYCGAIVAIVLCLSGTTAAEESIRQPNILFIMSDDHAVHAIGACGGRLAVLNPTPNIDRLAAEGVLMQNAFCVNGICTPSRANLMTGQHSHANGITTLRGRHGPLSQEQYGTSVGKRNQRRNMGHHMLVDPSLSDDDYKRTAYQRYLKKFLRCVKGVDDNIGRLLAWLEETGALNNTVIIYTADQGFNLGEHDYIDKRWMYEETLHMPFIVRYPPRFQPGTVCDDLVNNVERNASVAHRLRVAYVFKLP
jgi:arylsulfatase A-like enzyme